MRKRRRPSRAALQWGAVLVLAAAATAGVGVAVTSVGASTTRHYVALGDSYTSDPGVSGPASRISASCLQVSADYPHQIGAAEGFDTTDVSCAGATSNDMTHSQHAGVAPQFDALSPSTNVVTIGIGGNDNDLFTGALASCVVTDIADVVDLGSPCQDIYRNKFADEVSSDAATIGGVIAGIHSRAPGATVFVVGYPDILPQSGHCYPRMPLTTGDTAYLNGVEEDLNAMLASESALHDATFIDTYSASIGHDACTSGPTQWVNALFGTHDGIAVHPTPNGVAETAKLVEAAMTSKGL